MKADGDGTRELPPQLIVPGLLDALIERETRLRIDYQTIPEAPEETVRAFLRGTAALLELLYLSAVTIEVATARGARTIAEADAQAGEIGGLVYALTKLRPAQVAEENASAVASLPKVSPVSPGDPIPELAAVVSAADSIVRAWPVPEFVSLASRLGIHEVGARCQVAADGLQRFIKRHDPWIDRRLTVLGPSYSSGALTLDGVAQILGLNLPDTVALLEDCGYARPLDVVALTEEQRSSLYASLRESRLARGGKPEPSPSRIVRDVVATQRIEGIDARPWIDPKLM